MAGVLKIERCDVCASHAGILVVFQRDVQPNRIKKLKFLQLEGTWREFLR